MTRLCVDCVGAYRSTSFWPFSSSVVSFRVDEVRPLSVLTGAYNLVTWAEDLLAKKHLWACAAYICKPILLLCHGVGHTTDHDPTDLEHEGIAGSIPGGSFKLVSCICMYTLTLKVMVPWFLLHRSEGIQSDPVWTLVEYTRATLQRKHWRKKHYHITHYFTRQNKNNM